MRTTMYDAESTDYFKMLTDIFTNTQHRYEWFFFYSERGNGDLIACNEMHNYRYPWHLAERHDEQRVVDTSCHGYASDWKLFQNPTGNALKGTIKIQIDAITTNKGNFLTQWVFGLFTATLKLSVAGAGGNRQKKTFCPKIPVGLMNTEIPGNHNSDKENAQGHTLRNHWLANNNNKTQNLFNKHLRHSGVPMETLRNIRNEWNFSKNLWEIRIWVKWGFGELFKQPSVNKQPPIY